MSLLLRLPNSSRVLQIGKAVWPLEATYAGANIEGNWEALFRTMALFRRVATEVAEDLGYAYPLDLDGRVVACVREVRCLDAAAAR